MYAELPPHPLWAMANIVVAVVGVILLKYRNWND